MGKDKKRAQKKAPGAPKRGKSPYICFTMEKRAEIKEQLPEEAKVTEVMKKIAEQWRMLSQEDKAPWIAKATQDKQRYEAEMAHYSGPLRVPNKRAKKNPDAPKRAMSGFLFFSQIRRPQLKSEYPELKNTDISKLLGQQWKEMDEETKSPYVTKENSDRNRYREEMKAWNIRVKEEQKRQAILQADQQKSLLEAWNKRQDGMNVQEMNYHNYHNGGGNHGGNNPQMQQYQQQQQYAMMMQQSMQMQQQGHNGMNQNQMPGMNQQWGMYQMSPEQQQQYMNQMQMMQQQGYVGENPGTAV